MVWAELLALLLLLVPRRAPGRAARVPLVRLHAGVLYSAHLWLVDDLERHRNFGCRALHAVGTRALATDAARLLPAPRKARDPRDRCEGVPGLLARLRRRTCFPFLPWRPTSGYGGVARVRRLALLLSGARIYVVVIVALEGLVTLSASASQLTPTFAAAVQNSTKVMLPKVVGK